MADSVDNFEETTTGAGTAALAVVASATAAVRLRMSPRTLLRTLTPPDP
jgi:hypothetical protein